jgi:hypothetical protein
MRSPVRRCRPLAQGADTVSMNNEAEDHMVSHPIYQWGRLWYGLEKDDDLSGDNDLRYQSSFCVCIYNTCSSATMSSPILLWSFWACLRKRRFDLDQGCR